MFINTEPKTLLMSAYLFESEEVDGTMQDNAMEYDVSL